jgi:hypothetical protein
MDRDTEQNFDCAIENLQKAIQCASSTDPIPWHLAHGMLRLAQAQRQFCAGIEARLERIEGFLQQRETALSAPEFLPSVKLD